MSLAGSVPLGVWCHQLVCWWHGWGPDTEAAFGVEVADIGLAADIPPEARLFGSLVVVGKRQPVFRRQVPGYKSLRNPPLVADCPGVRPALPRRQTAVADSDARTHWGLLAS